MFWLHYDVRYTKASVLQAQNEFKIAYQRIFAISNKEEKQKNMLKFYMNTFRVFLANPQPPLILRPRRSTRTYTSSYSASDYSSNSFSYSDYSASSYSNNSSGFGGGSFGGGGASGDW